MLKENQSAYFIRMLTEAYEADRMMKTASLSARHKATAEKFKKQQLLALNKFRQALEPLDCVQLISAEAPEQNRR